MEEQITISWLQDQLEEKNQQLLQVEDKLAIETAARKKIEKSLQLVDRI